jgi:probable phosphoglycerate mutase
MNDQTWLLIRHAESSWNAEDRWQGHGNPPLSDRGRQQAEALARRLAGEKIDVLVSSDLTRAAETAAMLGRVWSLRPLLTESLRELAVGDWTGLKRDQIEALAPETLRRFEALDPDVRPGGGESRREIRLRARRAVAELVAAHPGRRLALVTHLGVIRALSASAASAGGTAGRESEPQPDITHCQSVELVVSRLR